MVLSSKANLCVPQSCCFWDWQMSQTHLSRLIRGIDWDHRAMRCRGESLHLRCSLPQQELCSWTLGVKCMIIDCFRFGIPCVTDFYLSFSHSEINLSFVSFFQIFGPTWSSSTAPFFTWTASTPSISCMHFWAVISWRHWIWQTCLIYRCCQIWAFHS